MKEFNKTSFKTVCRALANEHSCIKAIVAAYGLPPMFERPFSFETLVQIILEQQVSLASGKAAFTRLQQRLGVLEPGTLLALNVDALRTCSVSRQKARYLHHLSQMVAEEKIQLNKLSHLHDEEVRQQLMRVKGIGPWTADVVLMMCLQRADIFPLGDVALINSVRHVNNQPAWTVAAIAEYAQRYAPYRTMATYCYWHAYIQRKNITTTV